MFEKTRATFYNWLRRAEYESEIPPIKKANIGRGSHVKRLPYVDVGLSLDTRGIHFKVIPGSGGIAIEVNHFDEKSDRDITTLHVIPEGDELSEALAKIITLEAMKR